MFCVKHACKTSGLKFHAETMTSRVLEEQAPVRERNSARSQNKLELQPNHASAVFPCFGLPSSKNLPRKELQCSVMLCPPYLSAEIRTCSGDICCCVEYMMRGLPVPMQRKLQQRTIGMRNLSLIIRSEQASFQTSFSQKVQSTAGLQRSIEKIGVQKH